MFSQHIDWSKCQLKPNSIGPLNFAIGSWITRTRRAMEELPSAIEKQVKPLADYSPRYRLFLRSPNLGAYLALRRIVEKEPWGELRYGS